MVDHLFYNLEAQDAPRYHPGLYPFFYNSYFWVRRKFGAGWRYMGLLTLTQMEEGRGAAGSLRLGVSTGIRLPAGLSVRSPALDGSAVTPQDYLRDLRLL